MKVLWTSAAGSVVPNNSLSNLLNEAVLETCVVFNWLVTAVIYLDPGFVIFNLLRELRL